MKQKDLKPCSKCGKGVMHTTLPLFWKLQMQRFGIDLAAVRRQAGLEMMLGGDASLANVMGPDEDMAKAVSDKYDITLCEKCAMEPIPPMVLIEFVNKAIESKE